MPAPCHRLEGQINIKFVDTPFRFKNHGMPLREECDFIAEALIQQQRIMTRWQKIVAQSYVLGSNE
jgi:hypothetical protein